MKKLILIVMGISFFLSACGSVFPEPTSTPQPSYTPKPTRTSSPTSSLTASAVPTRTLTLLPPLSTFVPTFDVSKIITVTPAEKAVCPSAQPSENQNFDFVTYSFLTSRDETEKSTLAFLNTYGPEPLLNHLRANQNTEGENFSYVDMTNDQIPELTITLTNFYVFGCEKGNFVTLLFIERSAFNRPSIITITDNTKNGIPELAMRTHTWSQGGHAYEVYEWDGNQFRKLNKEEIWAEVDGKIFFKDIDRDQVNELILDSGVPTWETYYSGLPWRNERTIYEWDGQYYVPSKYEFDPPEFRFQAVQDGDLATKQLEFDKALRLYEEAIFNKYLKEYSPEIRKNLQQKWETQWNPATPAPTPYPSDITEYPRLAAYTYYRIMLLDIMKGDKAGATTIFDTLQEKFPADNPGHTYVEMAKVFMTEYQTTQNMTNACGQAIQYAVDHPKLLVPLGSDYHGWQSHEYKPEDVCPFR
jgi:hypothetical protein